MKTLTLAALLFCTFPAMAADRCADLASMYHMAHGLRDSGLSTKQVIQQSTVFYPSLTEFERARAVERVSRDGELGFLRADTIYRHVYLECKKSALASQNYNGEISMENEFQQAAMERAGELPERRSVERRAASVAAGNNPQGLVARPFAAPASPASASDSTTMDCPECKGSGEAFGSFACDECHGQGKIIVGATDGLIIELRRWAGDADNYASAMFRQAADTIERLAEASAQRVPPKGGVTSDEAIPESSERAPTGQPDAAFKNFHRALCERFNYTHDERDWKCDQVSLIEHIAKLAAPTKAAEGSIDTDEFRNTIAAKFFTGHADGYREMVAYIDTLLADRQAGPAKLTDGQILNDAGMFLPTCENGSWKLPTTSSIVRFARHIESLATHPGEKA